MKIPNENLNRKCAQVLRFEEAFRKDRIKDARDPNDNPDKNLNRAKQTSEFTINQNCIIKTNNINNDKT